MTLDPANGVLDPCGCRVPPPARQRTVPPGLPAIPYRLGTRGSFLRRMLSALATQGLPSDPTSRARPLGTLRTRAPDDPSIALLDTWAAVADVLAFYQERVVNEGYLRTATERRSVLELSRSVGYELGPGVAASVHVALTADDSPGGPEVTRVTKGTKILSVPAPGKLPQTYETEADLDARPEHNAMRLPLTSPAPQPPDPSQNPIRVQGANTDLKVGGRLLFVNKTATGVALTPKVIVALVAEPSENRTLAFLDDIVGRVTSTGYVAASIGSGYAAAASSSGATLMTGDTLEGSVMNQDLDREQFHALMVANEWNATDVTRMIARIRRSERVATLAPTAGPPPPVEGLYRFKARMGAFGDNAPKYLSLSVDQRQAGGAYPTPWDDSEPSIGKDSQGVILPGRVSFYLERVVPEASLGTWVLLEDGDGAEACYITASVEESRADFGLSARVTGLLVRTPTGTDPQGNITLSNTAPDLSDFTFRSTTINTASEPLLLADTPLSDTVGSHTVEDDHLTLEGAHGFLKIGQLVMVSGELAGVPGEIRREIALVKDLGYPNGRTLVSFESTLMWTYIRKTLSVNANVVLATHGETVVEVLGNGDASAPNQRFGVRKNPLTYVPAGTPSGRRSSLSLRVNGLVWDEAPSLYGLDERTESYIVRRTDDGKSWIIGGDGSRGARFPTGRENIVATYRSGVEPDGEVGPDSLILLKTKPLGIRSVTNPEASTGGQPPEGLDSARTAAPRTVLTMDRAVSLDDYENFAASFAGIGKAKAALLWNGGDRVVYIAVAASDGTELDPASETLSDLAKAVAAYQDPRQRVLIASFRRASFSLAAKVYAAPRYVRADVEADVRSALQDAFSFEKRAFGQSVTAAEVLAIIQHVSGVDHVDVNELYIVPPPPTTSAVAYSSVLVAESVHMEDGRVVPPELLLLLDMNLNTLEAEVSR